MNSSWFDDIYTTKSAAKNILRKRNVRYTPSAVKNSSSLQQLKRKRSPRYIVNGNWAAQKQSEQNTLSACIVNSEEIETFVNLLTDDPIIRKFLDYDRCFKFADKYLLAMVFVYFKRANLKLQEFDRTNFFGCLYLAHDMEEDDEDLKYEIFPWVLGSQWRNKISPFLHKKECIWASMNYRAVVSTKCCEDIFSILPNCFILNRTRGSYHGGAKRTYLKSPSSNMPKGPKVLPYCKHCHNSDNDSHTLHQRYFIGRQKSYFECSGSGTECNRSVLTNITNKEVSYEDENWLSQETFISETFLNTSLAKQLEEDFVAGEE